MPAKVGSWKEGVPSRGAARSSISREELAASFREAL